MKTEKLLFGMSLLFTLIAMAGCEKESEELPTCQNDQFVFARNWRESPAGSYVNNESSTTLHISPL